MRPYNDVLFAEGSRTEFMIAAFETHYFDVNLDYFAPYLAPRNAQHFNVGKESIAEQLPVGVDADKCDWHRF